MSQPWRRGSGVPKLQPIPCMRDSSEWGKTKRRRRGFRSSGLPAAGDLQRGGRNLGREETPVVCSEAAAMYCSGRWSTTCWLLREQHKVGRRRGVAKGAGGSRREQKAHANRPHPSAGSPAPRSRLPGSAPSLAGQERLRSAPSCPEAVTV